MIVDLFLNIQDELLDYTVRARRTAAETLRDFYRFVNFLIMIFREKSCRTSAGLLPEQLFDVFPTIRARLKINRR